MDFASTPAAPGPFKGFASEIGSVLRITAGVLGYKLGLGEGGDTTPLKIIVGLILVAISFLVAAAIRRLLQRRLLTRLNLERGMESTISSIITYVIIAFSVLFAMSVAGVPLRSLAFFAGALGIGIGFGLQNIIHNFVSGIVLLFERPVRVGDIVILGPELGGTVEKIGPRSTTIVTPDNIAVVVPNSKLIDSQIVNWSQPTNMMRVHINVGVAYGSDFEPTPGYHCSYCDFRLICPAFEKMAKAAPTRSRLLSRKVLSRETSDSISASDFSNSLR